jgi:protein-histidine pros-kinase
MTHLIGSDALPAVVRALPDATMLLLESEEVHLVNERVTELFGYSEAELVGRPFEVLVAAPDRPRAKMTVAAGRGAGALLGVRKDGTQIEVKFCVNAVELPITEGRASVVVLRPEKAEAEAARVLARAPDAILVVHRDGRILLVNDRVEALFGYHSDELLGRPVEALVPDRYVAQHAAAREEYFRFPHVRPMHAPNGVVSARRKDGTEFSVDIMLSPVLTESGLLAIAIVRDASDRRVLEEGRVRLARAEEALRLRDEFVSLVAHELRTPLTAVRLQLDALVRACTCESAAVGPDAAAGLRKVDRALRRTEGVVDELVDVSRIIGEGLELDREEVDLCDVARDEVDRALAQPRSAKCRFEALAKEPVVGWWDRRRVQQLVHHLLSNAIKYGSDKPVVVTVDRAGDDAILSMHDEGIGVAPEARSRLFNRFARFESSRHYGGLGLGLWIIKEIVEAHSGQITVRSSGAGATFRVVLPMSARKIA